HGVLKLVAETERPARLVVSASRPQTAGKSLVHQPSVRQYVEGRVRRFHVHRSERMIPIPPNPFERFARSRRTTKSLRQSACFRGVATRAEREHGLVFGAIREFE